MEIEKTYKITFKLDSPISFIDLPTFDGLLSYCYAKEQMKGKPFIQKLSYSKNELIDFTPMPIKLHNDGYFMASSMFHNKSNDIEFTERWRKRWANEHDNISDFKKQKRKVAINKGNFKSYDMPIVLHDIETVWFYFQSNNVNQVDNLIKSHLFGIGKKIAQGYGIIDSYEVEETEFDFNTVFRPIPMKFIKSNHAGKLKQCAWKPPYWMTENIDICVTP